MDGLGAGQKSRLIGSALLSLFLVRVQADGWSSAGQDYRSCKSRRSLVAINFPKTR